MMVKRFTFALAAAALLVCTVQCQDITVNDAGPYIPPQIRGDDGRRLLWKPKPGEKQCYEPDFSPDGTKVVVSYRDGPFGRDADLAILDLTNGAFKLILEGNEAKRPQWSPSGEWIAYETRAHYGSQIWIVKPNGSDNQPLPLGINEVYLPYWGPQGDKIYFVGHYVPREPLYALWYSLEKKQIGILRKGLDEFSHTIAVPSPAGGKLALALKARRPGNNDIQCVVLAFIAPDGTRFEVIWREMAGALVGIGDPRAWSPAGNYVLLRYAPAYGTGESLWTYEVKTRLVSQLTMCAADREYEDVMHGSWGPNGDIVFDTYSGPNVGRLYLIKAPE